MELCGECVSQPKHWDFLSNPQRHVILEFIYRRNMQLGENAASNIIVLYTPRKWHQAVEIQNLFEMYGFTNVIVVPESLLFVDNNKRMVKTTAMLIVDAFETFCNIHVIDESREDKAICIHGVSLKSMVLRGMTNLIDKQYSQRGGGSPLTNLDCEDLEVQLERHFAEPYVNKSTWSFEWNAGGVAKRLSMESDPWEKVYTDLLSHYLDNWLSPFQIKRDDIKRFMVVGYSSMAEDMTSASFNVFSGAYPVQSDVNQFLSSTIWDIIHHPELYAFASNGKIALSMFPSTGIQQRALKAFPSTGKRSQSWKKIQTNEKSMPWTVMNAQSSSSRLVSKQEGPFVFIFLYGEQPSVVGISMILNREYTPEEGCGSCYLEAILPRAFARSAKSKMISSADVTIGVVKDGQFDGPAVRQFIYTPIRWEGTLKAHQPEGMGRVIFQDELMLEGMYSHGKVAGKVHYYTPDAHSCRGYLVNDVEYGVWYESHNGTEKIISRRLRHDGDLVSESEMNDLKNQGEVDDLAGNRKSCWISTSEDCEAYTFYRGQDKISVLYTHALENSKTFHLSVNTGKNNINQLMTFCPHILRESLALPLPDEENDFTEVEVTFEGYTQPEYYVFRESLGWTVRWNEGGEFSRIHEDKLEEEWAEAKRRSAKNMKVRGEWEDDVVYEDASQDETHWVNIVCQLSDHSKRTVDDAFSDFVDWYKDRHSDDILDTSCFVDSECNVIPNNTETVQDIYTPEYVESLQTESGIFEFTSKEHMNMNINKIKKNRTGEGCLFTHDRKIVYMGSFESGKFNGEGVLFYRNGKKQYEGTFKNNVLHGRGTWYYPNGCVHYTGQWNHGEMTGHGSLYRFIDLEHCNATYRRFLVKEGSYINHVSFSPDFDVASLVNDCPHWHVC